MSSSLILLLGSLFFNSTLDVREKMIEVKPETSVATDVSSKSKMTQKKFDSVTEIGAIPVLDFNQLEPLLYSKDNKVYIVNFWAMWCVPCVKELHYLEEFAKKNPNVELILVSLDFPEDIDSKLVPFLKKKGITSKVVLLDDPDSNTWIDKIYPKWSGAIPFTIIFDERNRSYQEKSFESVEQLEEAVVNTIK